MVGMSTLKALGNSRRARTLLLFSFVLLGVLMLQDAMAQTTAEEVAKNFAPLVCTVVRVINNTVVRLIAFVMIPVSLVIWFIGNSNLGKYLFIITAVVIVAASTFKTWQKAFTGADITAGAAEDGATMTSGKLTIQCKGSF